MACHAADTGSIECRGKQFSVYLYRFQYYSIFMNLMQQSNMYSCNSKFTTPRFYCWHTHLTSSKIWQVHMFLHWNMIRSLGEFQVWDLSCNEQTAHLPNWVTISISQDIQFQTLECLEIFFSLGKWAVCSLTLKIHLSFKSAVLVFDWHFPIKIWYKEKCRVRAW